MGRFFEYVTAGLYGGRLGDIVELSEIQNGNGAPPSDIGRGAELDMSGIAKPDVVNDEEGTMFESKACRSGQTCKLNDEQIDFYRALQSAETRPKIYHAVYRHRLHGIKSEWEGTPEELFTDLSGRIAYSLVLPFRLVLSFFDLGNRSKYTYRYTEKNTNSPHNFYTCTCIKASGLTALFKDPAEVIENINLDVRSFGIRRTMSPSKFYIDGNKIRQFPVVFITDMEHERFAAMTAEQYAEEQGVPF